MVRLIILLSLFCLPFSAHAHQPDLSSTILAEKAENEWVLQVRAALTAFEYEVETRYGESAYATPEEFRELVAEYLRKELLVQFNGNEATILEDGVVNLGHETTVTFRLSSPPTGIQSVILSNTGFRHIARNQSAFYIAKADLAKTQVMLNSDNGYTANLQIENGQFVLVRPTDIFLPLLLLVVALVTLGLVYRTYARKQTNIHLISTLN